MLEHYYRYNNIDNKLNLLPHHEINYQNNRIKYTYDKYGKITVKVIINENNQQIEKYTYTYNSKNMLTNEYYEDDLDNGYTIHYTYDDAGNVVSVTKKDLNNVTIEHKSFAYSNNKLTTLTKNGLVKTFSYNTNDEPVSYGDNSLIWNEGKLSSFGNLSFEYDSNGRRTKKRIGNEQNVEYLYDDYKIIRSIKNNQKVDYLYDINDKLIGFKLLNNNYFYEREITGIITDIVDESGNSVVKYKYDGFGNILSATGDNTIIDNNIFLYKGYCYDVETGWFWLSSRYYSPELGRFIQPADLSTLNPSSINGLNLYSYANNNPIGIAYISSSSIGNAFGSIGNSISGSSSRIPLPAIPWLSENATTIYGSVLSLVTGIPILSHYYKYASIINDEFKLYGISKWKTSLQLSNVSFKMGARDGALIGVNVLIDMYDSYQRGVSTEGILLGGALTIASGVVMFYLNKGIMWATTTIGTAICPGIGTAIGFTVGLGISLYVDWKLGELISDWIDSITS